MHDLSILLPLTLGFVSIGVPHVVLKLYRIIFVKVVEGYLISDLDIWYEMSCIKVDLSNLLEFL